MTQSQLNGHRHVYHHLVDPIQNVNWSLVIRHVHAFPILSEAHQIADLNAYSIVNVLVQKLAFNKNVKTHVRDLVDLMQTAMF